MMFGRIGHPGEISDVGGEFGVRGAVAVCDWLVVSVCREPKWGIIAGSDIRVCVLDVTGYMSRDRNYGLFVRGLIVRNRIGLANDISKDT